MDCLCRPRTKEELFNLRHSSARMVIERIFGVSKKRFSFLRHGSFHPLAIQIRLVPAMCAIHNFIRLHDARELEKEFPEFLRRDFTGINHTDQEESEVSEPIDTQDNTVEVDDEEAKRWRDSIATRMWEDFQRKQAAVARRGGRRRQEVDVFSL